MKTDSTFIVKVQVPLATNTTPEAMVYNQDRSVQLFLPIDEHIKKAMKGRPKAFFRAGVKGDQFFLGTLSEVADPGW